MKTDRQSMILEIIEKEDVDTQEQLQQRLLEQGMRCTQATISRDIKQLHLIKEPVGQGRYRYTVSSQRDKGLAGPGPDQIPAGPLAQYCAHGIDDNALARARLAGEGVEAQREIYADGKNACRVCGRPVTVAQLRRIGGALLNIHGQHDGQQLLDEEQHGAYLDSYGRVGDQLAAYLARYEAIRPLAPARAFPASRSRAAAPPPSSPPLRLHMAPWTADMNFSLLRRRLRRWRRASSSPGFRSARSSSPI